MIQCQQDVMGNNPFCHSWGICYIVLVQQDEFLAGNPDMRIGALLMMSLGQTGRVFVMGVLTDGKFMTTMIHVSRSPYRKSGILYMARYEFNFHTGVLDRVPQLTYIHEGNIIIYLKRMDRISLLPMLVRIGRGHM